MSLSLSEKSHRPAVLSESHCEFQCFVWHDLPAFVLKAIQEDVHDRDNSVTKTCLECLKGTSYRYRISPNKTQAVIATQKDNISGWLFMPFNLDGNEFLLNYFVRERYRRNGIGSALAIIGKALIPGERYYQQWPHCEYDVAALI